jgi:hypothetical protein
VNRDLTTEPSDFQSRLRVLLGLQGTVLTEEELSYTAECYPRCRGKEHWDVREYARRTGVGAREYLVVRGSSIEDVYRSAARVRATAVGTALNELESQERSLEHPDREGADLRHPTRASLSS